MTKSKFERLTGAFDGCGKRMFAKNDVYFRKYVESTTAHGVKRVFSGKSVIRRVFWLVILLGAGAGCLRNVVDRILYFGGQFTSTAVSLTRETNLTFPAVTVCNLNNFRRENIIAINQNLSQLLRNVYFTRSKQIRTREACTSEVKEFADGAGLNALSLQSLLEQGVDPPDDFILSCRFAGITCHPSEFVTVSSKLGLCYTFNHGRDGIIRVSNSTGTRSGLSLVINVNQSQYVSSSSFDAGVKVAVHPQTEPPRPDDIGIGVPPGRNAFINIRKLNLVDNSNRNCRKNSNTSNFNYLTTYYNYSSSSCVLDCLLGGVFEQCGCDVFANSSNGYQRPLCNLTEICCVIEQFSKPIYCACPPACSAQSYDIFSSYSAFPAQYAVDDLLALISAKFDTSLTSEESLEDNLLSVNVYFETLDVEQQTTNDAYDSVALLSDIGGQLGLFLGISFISFLEFVIWIIDECMFRLCGTSFISEDNIIVCLKRIKNKGNESELEGVTVDNLIELKGVSSDHEVVHTRQFD